MNTKDLMIGDLIFVLGEISKIRDIYEYSVLLQDKNFYEIKPIPLTKEILEKNGVKEDFETNGIYWRPDCRKFCIVKELDTWYFAFRVLGETVDKSSGYICISECNYVHKLQHILKDLEIEKEIVL